MFTPWIKRKALKRSTNAKLLIVDGSKPSMITLLSVITILTSVGVFAVRHSLAYQVPQPTPAPTASASPSPVLGPTTAK